MNDSCELAPKAVIKAQFVPDATGTGGDLWIVATGSTPTPCWDVSIERSPLAIWPPQFAVVACPTAEACPEVVTPYSTAESYRVAGGLESVQVSDADGPHTVAVETVPDAVRGQTSDGSVVGVSMGRIDLAEAISRAAAQLPRNPNHPNVGVSMTINEIWYSNGGIVGPMLSVRGTPRT